MIEGEHVFGISRLRLNVKAGEGNSYFSLFCSMMGSDPATTNYPGKIPAGLDLPSDVAQEKRPEMGVSN